jgi:hypothetical protein
MLILTVFKLAPTPYIETFQDLLIQARYEYHNATATRLLARRSW